MRTLATIAILLLARTEALAPPLQIPTESHAVALLVSSAADTNNVGHQYVLASSSASALPSETSLLSTSKLLTATSVAPPATTSSSSTAATGSAVFIADINFDGKVPTVESDEYAVVTNGSKSSMDVSGYKLYVATSGTQGATFTFPNGSILKPSTSVRIYTNEIHKESGGYSFGSGKALWNNRGGLAVFQDASGKKIGEFKYKPASTA